MRWKDFLYFQRGSKTAVILLLILIVLTLVLNGLLSYRRSLDAVVMRNDSLAREFEALRRVLAERDSFAVVTAPKRMEAPRDHLSDRGSAARGGSAQGRPTQGNLPQPDERPLPGSGDRLSPRLAYPMQEKLSEGETISLNGADTAEWKRVPGIGGVYASRIVKYRGLLGGFARPEQLLEVYGIDRELFARMAVYIEPDGNFRRVQVNQSEFKELLRHPYLNYEQVQAIMGLRRRKGDIASLRELSMLDEFTADDTLRLAPYLEF